MYYTLVKKKKSLHENSTIYPSDSVFMFERLKCHTKIKISGIGKKQYGCPSRRAWLCFYISFLLLQ